MPDVPMVSQRGQRTRSMFKLWWLLLGVGLSGQPSGALRPLEPPFAGVGDASLTRLVRLPQRPERGPEGGALRDTPGAPSTGSAFFKNTSPLQPGHWPLGVALLLGLPVSFQQLDADDFELLPGIGPVLAQRIVATRSARGGFSELDDLSLVSGIGPHKMAAVRAALRSSGEAARSAERIPTRIEPTRKPPFALQGAPRGEARLE